MIYRWKGQISECGGRFRPSFTNGIIEAIAISNDLLSRGSKAGDDI